MRTHAEKSRTAMAMEDGAVLISGTVVASSFWWYDALYWVPETFKFIGLVATVIYLVIRAINEIQVFLRRD